MLLTPQSRRSLLALKATIKGLAEESARLRRNKINKLAKEEKQAAQLEQIRLGIHTRHHHLAYGFLRGMDYRQLEKRSGSRPVSNFSPMPTCVEWISTKVLFQLIQVHAPGVAYRIKEEDLEQWISVGKRFFLTKEEHWTMIERARKSVEASL